MGTLGSVVPLTALHSISLVVATVATGLLPAKRSSFRHLFEIRSDYFPSSFDSISKKNIASSNHSPYMSILLQTSLPISDTRQVFATQTLTPTHWKELHAQHFKTSELDLCSYVLNATAYSMYLPAASMCLCLIDHRQDRSG